MKLYTVISRTVEHTIGIDWIYPDLMTNNYEEAQKKFDEVKENLRQKMNNDNHAIIVQDEDRIFEVTYEKYPEMHRYVKLIDLY